MTFVTAERKSFPASEKPLCRRCNLLLLCAVYIFLWRSLYAFAAGLHLYKMYSIRAFRDDVDLKMPYAEVALKDCVSISAEQAASGFFSLSSRYLSFISAIFHSPSTFVSTAVLSLLLPYASVSE